jgi:hypothetical protein
VVTGNRGLVQVEPVPIILDDQDRAFAASFQRDADPACT